MKVIFKEFDDTKLCLFDLRSNEFLEGGCVLKSDEEDQIRSLLDAANYVASRQFYTIVDLADNPRYTDRGYTESMIAQRYLEINPDIRGKVIEKIKAKNDKKFAKKAKKEKKSKYVPEKPMKAEKPKVVHIEKPQAVDVPAPKKRGRPKKIVSVVKEASDSAPKKRGRPRKIDAPKKIEAKSSGKKRGRPRKNPN